MSMSLNSVTIPDPSEEEIEVFIRGTSYALADGSVNHEYVSLSQKKRWSFKWNAVTESDKDDLVDACIACLSGNRPFVDYNSDSYTVTAGVGRSMPKVTTVNAVVNRYNVSFSFEEV